MAFRRLAGLPLSADWQARLAAHRLETARDVFSRPSLELSELLDLSLSDSVALTAAIAAAVTDLPRSASDLLRAASRGPTLSLCESVAALRVMAGLTELVGPAGVGKSQCCFTLAVAAYVTANQLSAERPIPVSCQQQSSAGPGAVAVSSQHVVWLDTESTFSAQRVVQIGRALYPGIVSSVESVTCLLSHLLVLPAATPAALSAALSRIEETLVERPAALLVVDSIAAPVRAQYGRSELARRADYLGSVAGQLKDLSDRYQLPVLVTNQVRGGSSGAAGDQLSAALGVTWAHAVNTRWVLEDDKAGQGRRRLRLAKTPMFSAASYAYVVAEAGVVVGDRVDSGDDSWDVMRMRMTRRRELEGAGETEVEEGGGGEASAGGGDKRASGFYDSTEAVLAEQRMEDG